jgi:hypothetical protein
VVARLLALFATGLFAAVSALEVERKAAKALQKCGFPQFSAHIS